MDVRESGRSPPKRRPFVIQRVGKLRAGLDIDNQGRAVLNEDDVCPARVQVLRNIVTAVAGADDEDVLPFPGLAIVVLAGVENLPAEVAQGRDIGKVRNAADAGSHDYMSRTYLPLGSRLPDAARRTIVLLFHRTRRFGIPWRSSS